LAHPFVLTSVDAMEVLSGKIRLPVHSMKEALEVIAALARERDIELKKAPCKKKFFDILCGLPIIE